MAIWTGTVSVTNGDATVTVESGDALNQFNCTPDGMVVIAGVVYFVLSRTDTTTFELTRPYDGSTDTGVTAEISPLNQTTTSLLTLSSTASRLAAQLDIFDKTGPWFYYTLIGATGDADPGAGSAALSTLDFGSLAPGDAMSIYLDNVDGRDRTITGLLDTLVGGTIVVVCSLNSTSYVAMQLSTGIVDATDYRKSSATYIGHDGVLSAAEPVFISYARVGQGLEIDAQGVFADRDDYDAEPEGFMYYSVDGDGVSGVGTLYRKASNSSGDWSVGGVLQGTQGPPGEQGIQGIAGTDGSDGDDGASAYEVAVANGFVGNEAAWIASLNGADGADGNDGADGADGTQAGLWYSWDTGTSNSYLGSGKLWADGSLGVGGTATKLFAAKTNRAGDDLSQTLADAVISSNSGRKANFTISRSGENAQARLAVTGIVDHTDYVEYPIASGSHAGATGFDLNDAVGLEINQVGNQGSAGAGSGDMLGPDASVIGNLVRWVDDEGTETDDSGIPYDDVSLDSANLAGLDNKTEALDNLSLLGTAIASNTTVNLDTATGSLVHITGTTTTTAFTLTSGRRRRLIADGAWPITAGANVAIRGFASGQTMVCQAGDELDVWQDGTTTRITPLRRAIRDLNASEFGVVGNGSVDDTAAVSAAFAAAATAKVKLVFNAGTVIKLTSTISQSGFVDVDATGAKFAIAHTGAGFDFSAAYAETKDLSSNYTIGATTIAVNAMSTVLAVGEPFKIVSDAVDGADRDSGSLSTQYRTGEWAVATDGTTSTSIAIEEPLRFVKGVSPTSTVGDEAEVNSYTTSLNARIYRLAPDAPFRWRGGEFYYDASIDVTGPTGSIAGAITIGGRVRPEITHITVSRGGGSGIILAGNYFPVGSGDFRNLTDDQANGHGGYGVADASRGTRFHVTGGNVRHLYTSAYPKAAADTSTSAIVLCIGRIVGARVSGAGYGSGMTGVPMWDTHHASEDVIFENCYAENGAGGFSIRGRNIKIVNPTIRNCGTGILIFTEYQSGDTDDDLYVAKKSQDYFTSAVVVNADIECVTDPFTINSATVFISGSTRIRSAGHRLLANGGSEVHISGNLQHKVTTLLGARSIQEQTALGWVTMTDIVSSAMGAIPLSTTIFERGSSVSYDASLATDALDDIAVFDIANNCVLEANGSMNLALSGDFDFAENRGTLRSASDAGWISYSFAGAADNAITQNIARTGLRVRALDGTLRWDGAQLAPGETEKLLYANNNVNVTHTGSTSANNSFYTPPLPQSIYLDEDGHYQRVEIHLSKGGSAGTATCAFRAVGSFNEQIVIPAGDGGATLILEMFTRGVSSQQFRIEMVSYNASSAVGATVRSYKNRTFNIGAGSTFCTLGVTLANAADSITVEAVRVYGDKGGFV